MHALTLLTTAALSLLAAARCNHTATDGVGLAPVSGTCGNSTVHASPETGVCGGFKAMCTANTDCVNDYWCCSGYCIGTCNAHGIQHPSNGTGISPVGNYNGTRAPIDVYTGAASRMGAGLSVVGVAVGIAALYA